MKINKRIQKKKDKQWGIEQLASLGIEPYSRKQRKLRLQMSVEKISRKRIADTIERARLPFPITESRKKAISEVKQINSLEITVLNDTKSVH